MRNRATLGGNIANASPAADTAPALLVLGASVNIVGPDGTRKIPIQELFTGVKKTSLCTGEVITDVYLPPLGAHARSAFVKKQRVKGHDLAIVNMAAYCDLDAGKMRVAIGSCAVIPILLPTINSSPDEVLSVRPCAGRSSLSSTWQASCPRYKGKAESFVALEVACPCR